MQLVLFPASGKRRYLDYINTVEYSLNHHSFNELLNDIDQEHFKKFKNKNIRLWGITDGPNQVYKKTWSKVHCNDECFFYRDKKYFSKGKIKYKFINEEVSIKLWGKGKNGEIWKNLFVIEDLQNISITSHELKKILLNSPINILTAVKLYKLSNKEKININLLNKEFNKESQFDLYQDKLNNLNELTDVSTKSKRRLEQRLLSEYLFSSSQESKCSICSKTYPNDLMVAGHIKKRSLASESERKDLNIIIPICKIGCDELFEQGYIFVDKGIIKANTKKKISNDVNNYLEELNNKKCISYNNKNSIYFKMQFII